MAEQAQQFDTDNDDLDRLIEESENYIQRLDELIESVKPLRQTDEQ